MRWPLGEVLANSGVRMLQSLPSGRNAATAVAAAAHLQPSEINKRFNQRTMLRVAQKSINVGESEKEHAGCRHRIESNDEGRKRGSSRFSCPVYIRRTRR